MFDKKILAHKLRRRGKSIIEIANNLKVSKSTASLWCREIKLTDKQLERLNASKIAGGHKGRMIGAGVNKQRRLDAIQLGVTEGEKQVGKLFDRDLTMLAVALFWAEGAKTGSRFMFINSDPEMILCMYRYLREVEGIDNERFHVTIQINRVHEERIQKILKFWSKLLSLPLHQFSKPYYVNVIPKKIYENHDTYYGIARLGVRGGSSLQYKLLGYIDALKKSNNHMSG
ncbi:MAG: hypothetical protein WD605_02975 [Candidatus Paceibacterota bacterium]